MIVSCGEALIDFLPRQATDGSAVFAPFAGGSPFNVAIAIGRLGTPAGFFGGLSTDLFGDILRRSLHASGVDTSLANFSDRPTTLAFVSLSEGNARYAFFDEHSAGRMLTENDVPALPKTVTALHFGSFSLAEEPCGSTLEYLMQREFADRVISLDVNVRPTLIKNRDGYLARIDRLVAMADIVKLSEEDLAWLHESLSFDDLAARYLKLGAKIVVLTKGGDGAVAISHHAKVSVPGIAVKVADTVGAGDTFSAATLARLDQKTLLTKARMAQLSADELTDALTFAANAAAVTVSRPGANPPWLNELP
ncbi:MAG: carbohydrate kinase [Bauldia sp.]